MRHSFRAVNSTLCTALVLAAGFALGVVGGIANADDSQSASVNNGPVAASTVNRYELAKQILDRWEPIAVAAGQSQAIWRDVFSTQFALMDPSSLNKIAGVNADATNVVGSYRRFKQAIVNAGMQAHIVAQSKAPTKLGSLASDLVYIPIVPCRVVDTRNVGGPISFGTTRNFFFYTDVPTFNFGATQGGAAGQAGTVCPQTYFDDDAPQFAAAAITVTVVSPTAAGNFVVWGGANPIPNASALNWTGPGQVLANTTIVTAGRRSASGPGGNVEDFAVEYNGPSGSAQFVADVVGYFVENTATALQCVNVELQGTGTGNVANNTEYSFGDPADCTLGYTRVSTMCEYTGTSPAGLSLTQIGADPGGFSACIWRNQTGGALSGSSFYTDSTCCRLPGRAPILF